MMRPLLAAGLCAALAAPAFAQQAGLLARENRVTLPAIQLSSGMPLAEAPFMLKSGTYYIIEIEADGSAELSLAGSEFLRAVWINEIVVNDIEIRPLGLDSLEFDDEGKVEISFIAIKPGTYRFGVPGSDLQQATFVIE